MATKVNGLLSRLIFHRSILLPNYAWFDDLELSPSQVTTLIQVDVGRVANIFQSIHDLWTLPLEVIIAFILLYLQVKEAFFAGVVLIILIVPLNMLIAKRIGIATQGMMTQKDLRIVSYLFHRTCSLIQCYDIVYSKYCRKRFSR